VPPNARCEVRSNASKRFIGDPRGPSRKKIVFDLESPNHGDFRSSELPRSLIFEQRDYFIPNVRKSLLVRHRKSDVHQ